jgi:HEAT repeat protein
MLRRIFGFEFDLPEFILGLVLGMGLLWLVLRSAPHLGRAGSWLTVQFQQLLDSMNRGAGDKYRSELAERAGRLHMARALFALDQISVVPRMLVPPFPTDPLQTEPVPETTLAVLPNLPEWTYLSGIYAATSLTIGELLAMGKSALLTGGLGTGKSTALAYAAILLANRGGSDASLPILVHAADFRPDFLTGKDPLETVTLASQQSVSSSLVSRMPNLLRQAYRQGRAVLLLDGLDEFPVSQVSAFATFLDSLLKAYPGNRVIAAGPPMGYDGLAVSGLPPLAMLPWTEYDRRKFMTKWAAAWQKAGKDAPSRKGAGDVDPALLNGWLGGAARALTAAEVVARVWAGYAGDTRGPTSMDAFDVHLDRFLSDGERQSAESVAMSWIAEAGGAVSERGLRRGTAVGDLVDAGILIRRPAGRLSFSIPALGAYLAGSGLARSEITPTAPETFWLPAEEALRWYAATADVSSIVDERLAGGGDPLALNLLGCARWLAEAPAKSSWRANVLRGLATLAQKDSQPYGLRLRAVHALAASREPSVAILFRRMCESQSETNRILGALGLGGIGDEESAKTLLAVAKGDKSLLCQQAACLALGALGTDPSLEGLGHLLLRGNEAVQLAAAEALACQPDEGFNMLRDAITVENSLARRAAVFGLARVPEPWALELLEQAQIDDMEGVVRGAAAEVVERKRRSPWKIEPPPRELADVAWLVAFASREGLGIAPGKSSFEMLRRAMVTGSLDERLAAIELAGWTGADEFNLEFEQALKSPEPPIRDTAYEALWRTSAAGSSETAANTQPDPLPAST